MRRVVLPTPSPLDVHCRLDDGFSLCGGNKAPQVRHDDFEHLATIVNPHLFTRHPWQRCKDCVAMLEQAP